VTDADCDIWLNSKSTSDSLTPLLSRCALITVQYANMHGATAESRKSKSFAIMSF
jgi:hypothetical protein